MINYKKNQLVDFLEKAFGQEGIDKCWNMTIKEFIDLLAERISDGDLYKLDVPIEYVINCTHGGFYISQDLKDRLIQKKWTDKQLDSFTSCASKSSEEIMHDRCNVEVISSIREIGSKRASGTYSELRVIELPYPPEMLELHDYDGVEWIEVKTEKYN